MIQVGLILFLAGAVVGTLGDLGHVMNFTTGYPGDDVTLYMGDIPWWVPFLFGFAGLGFGLYHLLAISILEPHTWANPAPTLLDIGVALMGFLGLYLLSGFLPWPAGGKSDLILAALSLGFLYWCVRGRGSLVWGVFGAMVLSVVGTCFEINLVQNQVFYYQPHVMNLYGVASWLPWLYVAASGALSVLIRALHPRFLVAKPTP